MAKIIENPSGRRMIRLNPEDVASVIRCYQQQFHNHASPVSYEDLCHALGRNPLYLPEEV